MNTSWLIELAVAVLASTVAFGSVPADTPVSEEWKVRKYSNCDYAYGVEVPAGLLATVHSYDNHGFHVDLPGSQAQIWVINAYNMAESTSMVEVARYELQVESTGKEGWKPGPLRTENVGGLQAVRTSVDFIRGGRRWRAEVVVVYRPPEPGIGGNITYVFRLESPEPSYAESLPLFDRTLSGFRPLPLPRGPCPDTPSD